MFQTHYEIERSPRDKITRRTQTRTKSKTLSLFFSLSVYVSPYETNSQTQTFRNVGFIIVCYIENACFPINAFYLRRFRLDVASRRFSVRRFSFFALNNCRILIDNFISKFHVDSYRRSIGCEFRNRFVATFVSIFKQALFLLLSMTHLFSVIIILAFSRNVTNPRSNYNSNSSRNFFYLFRHNLVANVASIR